MSPEQKILIVDDRSENLVALERVLRPLGVHVKAVNSGNAALAATLHEDFAMAILDVQMPEMDGYELAELLRSESKTSHLPIIFMSAVYSDDYHVFRGYEAGAVDFLTKPYNPDILLNKVRFFLQLDAQRYELREKLQIQRSKSYLESILTSMTDSVIVVTADDRVQMANRAAQELLGYQEEELLGARLGSLFPDGVLPAGVSSPEEASSSQTRKTEEVELACKKGQKVSVLLSASVLRDSSSKRSGLLLAAKDNTERKNAEAARRDLEAQLRHSQRMESLGLLAGGVAHDFNNLLTVVMSCSSFASGALGKGHPVLADLERIMVAAERAKELVGQLLAFGHKQVLHPEVVDLNDTVSTTTHMLERVLGEDVALEVDLAPVPLQAFVDPGQLTQVLVNLAVNARDAMTRGGKLFVSTRPVPPEGCDAAGGPVQEFVRLVVRDTGCGMQPEVTQRIFEPFFTTKELGRGTGLGLSVVHGIIEQSKGSISVESEAGRGTAFTVDLPCPPHGVMPFEQYPESVPLPARGGTVLVVEDNDAVRGVVTRILQGHGFEVLAARAPGEVAELATEPSRIDLLLSDVVMPECSGPEVAMSLRKQDPELPVIFMSGHAYDSIEVHGVELANVDILQKPFAPSLLVSKVRAAIRR